VRHNLYTIIIGVFCFWSFFTSISFADSNYKDIYPVGSEGSFTRKDVFTLGERPWLYLRFEDKDATSSISDETTTTTWTWDNPSGLDQFYIIAHEHATQNSVWIGFDQNVTANVGTWSIDSNSGINVLPGSATKSFSGSTGFTVEVVPEPVGILLFLTGGLTLGALRRKKIKK